MLFAIKAIGYIPLAIFALLYLSGHHGSTLVVGFITYAIMAVLWAKCDSVKVN